MDKLLTWFSNHKTMSFAVALPIFYCLWLLWYSCYYSEYSQLVKAIPALLFSIYLVFGYRKNRFHSALMLVLFCQVAIWILLFFDSQTAFYYAYHAFSLVSIPLFAIKELSYFLLHTAYYLLLAVLVLVKPQNTVVVRRILSVAVLVCVGITLLVDGFDFVTQLKNQSNWFYILLDFLLMWLTEFGYWLAFVLFVPAFCRQAQKNKKSQSLIDTKGE